MYLKDADTRLYESRCFWAAMESFAHGIFSSSDAAGILSRAMLWYDNTNDMDYWYRKLLPSTMSDIGDQLAKPKFNLLQSLAETKAVAFRENVSFDLLDPDNNWAPIEGKVDGFDVDRIPDILWKYGVREALQRVDELSTQQYGGIVRFKIASDGRLITEAMPYYCAEFDEYYDDPSDWARASSCIIPMRGDAYPQHASEEISYRYIYAGGKYYAVLQGDSGHELTQGEQNNPIPVLPNEVVGANSSGLDPRELKVQAPPFVVWRERKIASPYAPMPRGLLDAQVEVNVVLAYVDLAFRLGAHGKVILSQIERNAQEWAASSKLSTQSDDVNNPDSNRPIGISGALHAPIVVPPGWEAKLMPSQTDPGVLTKYVEATIRRAYVNEGMNAGPIQFAADTQPSNYSGTAKMIDAAPTEMEKQRREPLLRQQAAQTLEAWRKWHNITAPEEDRIPERFPWGVTFKNMWNPGVLADQSSMQGLQIADEMGVLNIDEFMASMNSVTQTAGGRMVYRNKGRAAAARKRFDEPTTPAPTE